MKRMMNFYTLLICIVIFNLLMFLMLVLNGSQNDAIKVEDDIEIHSVSVEGRPKINTRFPTIVWWTGPLRFFNEEKSCPSNNKCHFFQESDRNVPKNVNAYLFYASTIDFLQLPLPRQPDKTIWAFVNEESPRNVEEFMHDKALNLFNYSSTFSRFSDVPFPLSNLRSLNDITDTKYYVNTERKNTLLKHFAPVLFLNSDCETSTERDSYVAELMKFISVDSPGSCLNNKQLPSSLKVDYVNKLYDDESLKFISNYKFMIAIENGVCDDYVTEKFWRLIHVGVVPIYFGSPSIRDWLPNNKSAILLEDYPTPKLLSEYLKKLIKNDALYEDHLEHKIKGLITNKRIENELKLRPYQNNFYSMMQEFECFLCDRLYDKTDYLHHIVDKKHYDCPTPISALTLDVNPANTWVQILNLSEKRVKQLYDRIAKFS